MNVQSELFEGPSSPRTAFNKNTNTNSLIDLGIGLEEDDIESETTNIDAYDSDCATLLPIPENTSSRSIVKDIKDPYNLVSITFLLLGVSTLMPWSFFITANDYWMYKFRNTSLPYPPPDFKHKTFLQTTYASWISIASNLPAFFALLVNSKLLRFPEVYRNGISQVFIILLFVSTTGLVFVNSDTWQYGFFALTIATIVLMNVAGAVFQAGVVGLTALFPEKYMHSMVTGQGLAAVFAATAQILALLENASPTRTAMLFFISALVGLVIAFLAYFAVHKTAAFKYYSTVVESGVGNFDQFTSSFEGSINSINRSEASSFMITKHIWACALSVFFTFTVSMSVFPGLSVLVVSQHAAIDSPWTGRLFLPVASFLLFAVADFCGRLSCGFLPFFSSGTGHKYTSNRRGRIDYFILALSICRVLLIPAFMLCNAHPRSGKLPILFPQDQAYIVFTAVLGFTNGFCFCAPMIIAPMLLPVEYRERAGSILTMCLLAGLSIGSLLSFPLVTFL